MNKVASGFTLIELMVVIAIMGILTTLALPSYQDKIIRAQVGEAIELADLAKRAVSDYYARYARLPEDNLAAGLPVPTKLIGNFVTAIEVDHGAISITLGNRVNKNIQGKLLSLRPALVPDTPTVPIAWQCAYAEPPQGMALSGENTTTLLRYHLPLDCQS